MIKAVFFDVDETIVASVASHREANRLAFLHYGYDFQKVKESSKGIDTNGFKIYEVLRTYRDQAGISEQEIPLDAFYELREQIFYDKIAQDAGLMPGAYEALEQSRREFDIVALVTSGSRKFLEIIIAKFDIGKFLDFSISGDEVRNGKPAPDCFLLAYQQISKELNVTPAECLVVEDAFNGVKAAKAAGMHAIFIPSKNILQLSVPDADRTYNSLREVDFHELQEL